MLRKALICAGWNLYALRKNPRFYLSLLLGFLLCWLLTDKIMAISREYMTNLQLLEPFVWCYADADSILFASLVMMLVLSDFPRVDASAAPLIFRAGRRTWLLGQVLTVLAITLGYCLMILTCSVAMCAGHNVFTGNHWSETAAMLSFAPENFEVALSVMRKTVKLTTPCDCAWRIFLLLFQYMLLLASVQLVCTIRRSRRSGVAVMVGISFAGFVLSPDRLMAWLNLPQTFRYYANVLSAWLSPLQHATYVMHNFGYDFLPRFGTSCALLSGAAALMLALALLGARRFPFNFSGGDSDDA